MKKWLIYKHGPGDWRVSRGVPGGWILKARTFRAAVAHMNNVERANKYAAIAA